MRYVQKAICRFSELSDTAKDAAKQEYAASWGYSFQDEAFKSLRALAEHFGGKLKNYSVDFFKTSHSDADFEMPELEAEEIKDLLDQLGEYDPETLMGTGECKLTGYCADEDAIEGFRKAWHAGETDLEQLMEAAFDSWLESCQADCEAFYENEEFDEHCEANDYEFDENGHMTKK